MDPRQKDHRTTSIEEPALVRAATIEDLKDTELYRDLSYEAIQQTLLTSRICRLEPGQRLYTTRNEVDYLYIVSRGYVSIWTRSYFNPADEVFLAWRGPQHILGELRQIGTPPSNTEITACDSCEFIEIRLDSFLDLAANNCFLYRNIAILILRKMWHEGQRSEVVQTTLVRRRLAKTLIHLAQDRVENFSLDDSVVQIPGTLHQDELGFYAGAGRHSVNIELNKLKDEEIINFGGGNKASEITILKLQDLLKIIQSPPTSHPKKSSRERETETR
jgi:CRP-like cAMP-binding protein